MYQEQAYEGILVEKHKTERDNMYITLGNCMKIVERDNFRIKKRAEPSTMNFLSPKRRSWVMELFEECPLNTKLFVRITKEPRSGKFCISEAYRCSI